MESFIVKTAKTYLDLGGPHSLSWPVTTGLDEVAVGLDEALDRYLMNSIAKSELTRDMISNLGLSLVFTDFEEDESVSLEEIEKLYEPGQKIFAVKIFVTYYSVISIGFLECLQKKRQRRLYEFMRNLLETVYMCGIPCHTQLDYCEMGCYDYYEDAAEEDLGWKEAKESLDRELELFAKHFTPGSGKLSLRKRIRMLNETYPRIKRLLTESQRAWVQSGLDLIEVAKGMFPASSLFIPSECVCLEDAPLMDMNFTFIWDNESHVGQQHDQEMNSTYGEYGGPADVLRLGSRVDIVRVGKFVEYLSRVMNFFYTFDRKEWYV